MCGHLLYDSKEVFIPCGLKEGGFSFFVWFRGDAHSLWLQGECLWSLVVLKERCFLSIF